MRFLERISFDDDSDEVMIILVWVFRFHYGRRGILVLEPYHHHLCFLRIFLALHLCYLIEFIGLSLGVLGEYMAKDLHLFILHSEFGGVFFFSLNFILPGNI